jgi:radical SAM superfamily enzyme YgiQ (UPF0313 family)
MKILLVYPNSRDEVLGWGTLGAIAEPLALEYLGAALTPDGHSVRILDLRLHAGELDDTLRQFAPDVVGVTGYSMHVLRGLAICRRAKELCPGCRTVAGGHHATLMPDDFFEEEMDFVVSGEGTVPLRELVSRLGDGRPVHDIPGLWSRVGGKFVCGGIQPELDLDTLVLPDRSLTQPDRPNYFIDWMKPVALMRSTVGCPYRCNFCSLWKIMDGRYLKADVQRVVDDVRTIREDFVFMVDDEAFIDGPRMMRLAKALKEAGQHKRYFAYCRIDTLLREHDIMTAWREVGLERLFIGIEAYSPQGLSDFNKKCTVPQVEAGLQAARELGIKVMAQFIVRPDFSKRDFQGLVRFIEHHKIEYPSFTILTPLPGTEALTTFDSVVERQPNGRPQWDLWDCQSVVVRTRLPRDEFLKEYHNLHRVFSGAYAPFRSNAPGAGGKGGRTPARLVGVM